MSQEPQLKRPVTYQDVFGDAVQGEVAKQPITIEDAALMQSAETIGLGKTVKGGAASLMQSAADKNVREHIVDPASHSDAAERGFGLRETMVDGKVYRQEFVGDQPVSQETTFVPTLADVAATQGITIGEALEEAAQNDPEKVVDKDVARTIQSAEAHATGVPLTFKGGVAALAQSAAQKNADQGEHITLSDVLGDATDKMLVDKVVTTEDVEKIKQVVPGEAGSPIVSSLQEAVKANTGADNYLQMQQEGRESLPSSEKQDATPAQKPAIGADQPQTMPAGQDSAAATDQAQHPKAD